MVTPNTTHMRRQARRPPWAGGSSCAAYDARSIRVSTTGSRSQAAPLATRRRSATGLASWTCSIERSRLTKTTGRVKLSAPPERHGCIDKARTLAESSAVRNPTASSTFSAKSASGRNTASDTPNPRMDLGPSTTP